jgi:hypothetical protein
VCQQVLKHDWCHFGWMMIKAITAALALAVSAYTSPCRAGCCTATSHHQYGESCAKLDGFF